MGDGLVCSSKPSEIQRYTRFGAQVKSTGHRGVTVAFDELSLKHFYLYDVLLHELGHHADRLKRGGEAERYAKWFAEFQQTHLPPADD